ncbi:ABC transporter permease, partial [bacterium]|nr:ABC transporter permease [bacterium]
MKFEFLVAFRYLWDTRRTRFLSFISLITVLGVAIGVMSLIVVQSVMDGLQNHMKGTILGAKAHLIIESRKDGLMMDSEHLKSRLLKKSDVVGATAFIKRDAMVSRAGELLGAVVTGIDVQSVGTVFKLPHQIKRGSFDCLVDVSKCEEAIKINHKEDNDIIRDFNRDVRRNTRKLPGVIIGTEMAAFYALSVGDKLTLISPTGTTGISGSLPATQKVRVAAIFYSGLYEFDLNYVYTTLDTARTFFNAEGVDGIALKLQNPLAIDHVKPVIQGMVDLKLVRLRDWKTMNRAIFGALKMERLVWFLIMGFVVLVAGFNIISMLIMVVLGKMKEIAVLKTLGASRKSISLIFLIQGSVVGIVGTTVGLLSAAAVVFLLDGQELGAGNDIYYLTKIPVDKSLVTFLFVGLGTL